MDEDASAALGAPEVAGSFVNPRGLVKKLTPATRGTAAPGSARGAPDLPRFGRVGYLSLTRDEIAIVRATSGLRTRITDEVLARVPRTAITGVVFDGGMLLSQLAISFDNGVVWELDIPKVNKKTAQGSYGSCWTAGALDRGSNEGLRATEALRPGSGFHGPKPVVLASRRVVCA